MFWSSSSAPVCFHRSTDLVNSVVAGAGALEEALHGVAAGLEHPGVLRLQQVLFVLFAEPLGGFLLGTENLDPAFKDVEHLLGVETRLLGRDLAGAGQEQVAAEPGEPVQIVAVLGDALERAFEELHHLDPRIAHRIGVGAVFLLLVLLGIFIGRRIVGVRVRRSRPGSFGRHARLRARPRLTRPSENAQLGASNEQRAQRARTDDKSDDEN